LFNNTLFGVVVVVLFLHGYWSWCFFYLF